MLARIAQTLSNEPHLSLAKFLLDGLTDAPNSFTAEFLKQRLLGADGIPGIFTFDFSSGTLPSLDDVDFAEPSAWATDPESVERLWTLSESLVRESF